MSGVRPEPPSDGQVSVEPVTGFGPSALATPANAVTVIRLLVSPLLFAMIGNNPSGWLVWFVWTVLSLTDGVDGWVARRYGTTRSGAFLDPLADKVLILGAMFTLVNSGVFWVVPVAIIAVREFVVSIYRTVVGTRGVSMPAIRSAKYKTVLQQLAVAFALMPLTALDATWLWQGLLWAAVVLAVVSGAQYLMRSREGIPDGASTHAM
jgi:CDP-diacylglycerol---glycerol-3-phosphate 3-phosphatidyltransferase